MESKRSLHFDGINLEQSITGDLAGSQISVAFKDSNEGLLDQKLLDSPVARRMAGLEMICTDLKLSQNGLQRFLSLVGDIEKPTLPEDTVILQALWTSSVILYCKPFVDAEGRVVVLKFNQVFKGDLEKKLDDHKKLMKLRNQHLAHCGALGLQQHLVSLIKKPSQPWDTGTIKTWGIYASLPHPRWVKTSLDLISAVLESVQAMRFKAEDRLKAELQLGVQDDLGKLIVEIGLNKP